MVQEKVVGNIAQNVDKCAKKSKKLGNKVIGSEEKEQLKSKRKKLRKSASKTQTSTTSYRS